MKRLVQFRIRIPGEWMDVWLYKGSVLLWSPKGQLFWVALDALTSEISHERGIAARLLAEYLIFRNDWKVGEQFQSLQRIAPARDALLTEAVGDEETVTFVTSLVPQPIPNSEPYEGYLLDVAVTGNRIFSATTQGLFETEFNPEYPDDDNEIVKNVDGRVNTVAINGNRAAIAMEETGLLTGEIEFGGGSEWADHSTSFKTVDDYAIAASFSSYNLLNYRGERTPDFLRAKKRSEPAKGRQAYDRTVIVEHERPVSIAEPLMEAASLAFDASRDVNPNDVYVVGNSNFRLLVSDGNEYAAVINLGWGSPAEKRGIAPNREFTKSAIDVKAVAGASSTQELKSGFVLEGFDYIGLMTERGYYRASAESVLRTRTFPRSRRHADTFAVVGNHDVEIAGFLETDG
jgi:hypothetical protein